MGKRSYRVVVLNDGHMFVGDRGFAHKLEENWGQRVYKVVGPVQGKEDMMISAVKGQTVTIFPSRISYVVRGEGISK